MERMENNQIAAPYSAVPTNNNRELISRIFYGSFITLCTLWLLAMTLFTYQ